MNNTIKIIASFVVGAAIGAYITDKVVETKYEAIAQEEIDSVKEVFSKKEKIMVNNVTNISEASANIAHLKEKDPLEKYAEILGKKGYTDYSRTTILPRDTRDDPDAVIDPHIISPEELGDQDGYDVFSLTLFDDGVVADDDDRRVDDWPEKLGADALEHFGEYGEEDAVHVRNDMFKCDYEVLRDLRKYSDVIKTRPHDLNN